MFRTQVKMPLITVVLVSLMVIGCCVAAAEEERFGGTLRVAIIGEPTGLDMFHAYGVNPWKIFQHIVEPLFEYDAEWQPVPHLLDSYTAEDNNTRYILNLRKGVMFHNGKEMKAEDVQTSFYRYTRLNSYWKSVAASKLIEMNIVDDYTVEILLNSPSGLIPYLLVDAWVYPKEVIDKYGDTPVPANEIIGSWTVQVQSMAAGPLHRDREVRRLYAQPEGVLGARRKEGSLSRRHPVHACSRCVC